MIKSFLRLEKNIMTYFVSLERHCFCPWILDAGWDNQFSSRIQGKREFSTMNFELFIDKS